MTTVKELIKELQKCDQDAIVLYQYNENGDTGLHDFINEDFIVALDKDGNIMMDEEGELFEIFNRELDEHFELIVKRGGTLKPAIKFYCH